MMMSFICSCTKFCMYIELMDKAQAPDHHLLLLQFLI
jgi:hypothetical protein